MPNRSVQGVVITTVIALTVPSPGVFALPKPAPVVQTEATDFTTAQLDALLAPIALYPDELLTQTLMASAFPLQEGEPDSPLEPLVAQAREEGYPVDQGASGPRPYHGYCFRILTAQGPSTPDGARSYISNGRMTSGFALLSWPVSYGISGLMSFIVNQDGDFVPKGFES